MRVLVTGAGGMLAHDILALDTAHEFVGADRAALDITDRDACIRAAAGFDAIINCAAYTNVDQAETDEESAYAINALGAENLAVAAREAGATLFQISTDYVFDGNGTAPYAEGADRAPLGAYGRTKAAGEELALAAHEHTVIVRVAWLYGLHGANFVKTMLRLASERDRLTVVDDQIGQPTSTVEVAAALVALLDAGQRSGIFHATCAGETSWWGFTREIFSLSGLDPERVDPVTSAQFVRPAARPAYSVLSHEAMKGIREPARWQDALAAELQRMAAAGQ